MRTCRKLASESAEPTSCPATCHSTPDSVPAALNHPTPAGLPLMNKRVYETEQKMAELRDSAYDKMEAKNDARNQRLKGPTFQ